MSLESPIILTIIIPFHYEANTIAEVLTQLQTHLNNLEHEILLIHDNSNDPTLNVIATIQKTYPQIKVILNQHRPGVPGALKTGLDHSRGEYILFMVADDASPAVLVTSMLNLLNQGFDLVSLSRYLKGGKANGGSFLSRLLSLAGNKLFVLLTRSNISDMTCGFKMFRKSILNQFPLKSDADWTLPFELAVWTQYAGLKTAELPFISNDRRQGGPSHFRLIPRVYNYTQTFLWGVTKLWRRHKNE